jgi:insertion element IS1 protein InsB
MAMNGVDRASARIMGVGLNTILRHLLRPQSVTSRIQPGSDVIVCAEMDEQWGYVGAKSRQRWLFTRMTGYGGRLWRTYSVNARCPRWSVFWACCRPLRSLWMTDGWPLYESRLKENCTLSASDIRSALSGIT